MSFSVPFVKSNKDGLTRNDFGCLFLRWWWHCTLSHIIFHSFWLWWLFDGIGTRFVVWVFTINCSYSYCCLFMYSFMDTGQHKIMTQWQHNYSRKGIIMVQNLQNITVSKVHVFILGPTGIASLKCKLYHTSLTDTGLKGFVYLSIWKWKDFGYKNDITSTFHSFFFPQKWKNLALLTF